VSNTAFCEQCQGPIEASDRYCPNCGQTQVTVDEPAKPVGAGQAGDSQPWNAHLASFSREEQILAGIAVVLAVDLLFLPWFEIGVASFSFSTTATQNPDGWLGVLGVLAALALIADLAIERLSPHTHVPSIPGGRPATRFLLASAAAGCVALKFLFHIHFSLFGAGFWIAAALSVALVVLASRLGQISAVAHDHTER
jgi:hypothetical protein